MRQPMHTIIINAVVQGDGLRQRDRAVRSLLSRPYFLPTMMSTDSKNLQTAVPVLLLLLANQFALTSGREREEGC